MSLHCSHDLPVVSESNEFPLVLYESNESSLWLSWVTIGLSEYHESPLVSISLSDSHDSPLVS